MAENDDTINKHKTGRKRDQIRDYYKLRDDKLYCTIDKCTKKYSIKTSTVTLKYHIYNYHNMDNITTDNDIINNANNINNNMDKISNEMMMYKLAALMFAGNSLPYSLIENQCFINFINFLNADYKITKSKLKEFILSEGEQVNKNVTNMLSINKQPITVAFDGWTNVRSNKVTNILLICSGKIYYYTSVENKTCQNTSNYLIKILDEKINFLLKSGLRLTSITTDNENVMKMTRQELNKKYPILIIIPCSAHIIQLCFKSLQKIEAIKNIIDEILEIIYIIRNNKKYKLKLSELQVNDGIKDSLKLKYPSEIRWTSLIMSIERFIFLKKYINMLEEIIPKPKKFWNSVDEIYTLLKPFKKAINNIQADNASLYSVWINFNEIINYYKIEYKSKIFKKNLLTIVELIEEKWNKHINIELIETIRLLNLEQNFKYNGETMDFIINWGNLYLKTYGLVKKDNNGLDDVIEIQLNEFVSRQNEFININSDNEQLKEKYKKQEKKYDIKALWYTYIPTHYELANIAIAILSICPSEACVERSFSIQSDVHTLKRNKLLGEYIEAEMNIKMNNINEK